MSTTENGWTQQLPTANGIYWYQIDAESTPDVVQIHNRDVYYTGEAGATSLTSHVGGQWLGPISPSDFQQLAALREVGDKVVQAVEFALTTPGMIRGRNLLEVTVAALREALGDK